MNGCKIGAFEYNNERTHYYYGVKTLLISFIDVFLLVFVILVDLASIFFSSEESMFCEKDRYICGSSLLQTYSALYDKLEDISLLH